MDEEERVHDALEGLSVNSNNNDVSRQTTTKEENADSTSSTPNHSKGPNSRSLSPENGKSQSDSISTPEAGPRPKMSRKASQKVPPRPVTLFTDLPDVTADSKHFFELIEDCMYGSKTLGSSKQDALDCDCSEEWRKSPTYLHIYIPIHIHIRIHMNIYMNIYIYRSGWLVGCSYGVLMGWILRG